MIQIKKLGILFGAVLALGVVPVASAASKRPPPMTPMELQALQSKEFETSKDNLFVAVMTVVQDLGYQVQSADLNTGFITAISAAERKTNFFEALSGSQSSMTTKMTAFVQRMPNAMSRVRLNFLLTKNTSSSYGQSTQQDQPVLDPVVYRSAWDKIDEALFVNSALEAPSPTPQGNPEPKAAEPAPAPAVAPTQAP